MDDAKRLNPGSEEAIAQGALNDLVQRVFFDYEVKPTIRMESLDGGRAGQADPEAWSITLESDEASHDRIECTLMHEAAHLLVPQKDESGCHTPAFFCVLNALCLAYLDAQAAEDCSRDAWEWAVDSAGEW